MKAAVLALFCLGGLLVASEEPTKFKVTTKKADDAVTVRAEKESTVFSVRNPSGIGQAVVERKDDQWPETVLLRLYLKGLESFRISNGKVMLDAAVSVQDGKGKVRLWKDGKEETPLDEKSPLWMNIRVVYSDGNSVKELPLGGGYFEMTLPKVFFEGSPPSITLNWIDFYRN